MTNQLQAGAVIAGKYELKAQLGKGGFGTVWRALHQDLGKDVALKVLNAEVANNEEAQQRFLREVEATTSFVHKYAAQLRDFGQDRERNLLYFTMEVVEGPTLADVLRDGPLRPDRAVRVVCQVLEALAEAHDAGLVHRDLKPANLILTEGRRGEEVRVLDFGIAKAVSRAGVNTSGLTLSGMTIGTLGYMSPEQVQGKKLDGRSDLYSLGVVLYQALTKRMPIEAEDDAEDTRRNLSYRIVNADATPLTGVPSALAEVVMQALAKDKSERPADALTMRDALQALDLSSGPEPSASFQATGAVAASQTVSHTPTGPAPLGPGTTSFKGAGSEQAQYPATTMDPVQAGKGGALLTVLIGMGLSVLVVVVALGVGLGLDLGGLRTTGLALLRGEEPTEKPALIEKTAPIEKTTTPNTALKPREPELVELAPRDGFGTKAETITVRGRLQPPLPGIVRINGIKRALGKDGRFELAGLALDPGINTIDIRAEPEGKQSISRTLRVALDREPPVLEVTAPADGAKFYEKTVEVRGTVRDDSLLAVTVNGEVVTKKAGEISFRVLLPKPGKATLTVVATDQVGHEVRVTRHVVRLGSTLLVSPKDGTRTNKETVDLTLLLQPPGPGEVRFKDRVYPLPASGKLVRRGLKLAEGANAIEVEVRPEQGRSFRETITIHRDGTPPTLRVESPKQELVTHRLAIDVAGTVTDEGGPKIDVQIEGRPARLAKGRFRLSVPLAKAGVNLLRVVARDRFGNAVTRTVKVSRRPFKPHPGASYAVQALQGRALDGERDAQRQLGLALEHGRGVRHDLGAAASWYRKAAEAGDVHAMSRFATRLRRGEGVPSDDRAAQTWYERAAAGGDPYAQGMLHTLGWGKPKNNKFAASWLQTAATRGDTDALVNLGYLHLIGQGVARDDMAGLRLVLQAKRSGSPAAWTLLGWAYSVGRGVPRDATKSVSHFRKAAAMGSAAAMSGLGHAYSSGRGVARDYAKAREWFLKSAEFRFDEAMYNLGWLYQAGRGVPQDYLQARTWYLKAAALQNHGAMNNLGWLHQDGLGVPRDLAKAREWYRKAAALGNGPAANNLGLHYRDGRGVPQDYAQAKAWFLRASSHGYSWGATNLGWLYQKGWGVKKDYDQARKWYQTAAARGNSQAMNHLGLIYEKGFGVGRDYVEARKWYRKAAELGHSVGMVNLARLYRAGRGVAKSDAKATEWYRKAGEAGNATGMLGVGWSYEYGRGVSKSYYRAREWYARGAAKGNPVAMSNLGLLYQKGLGVSQDYDQARAWYFKAAAKGHANAMSHLGSLYRWGRGVSINYKTAMRWYRKGAERGSPYGMYNVGLMYRWGRGVSKDYDKAREWYFKAAAKGNARAMNGLGLLYRLGNGVSTNYGTARRWYLKAAAKGNADSMNNLGVLYMHGYGVQKNLRTARRWFRKAIAKGNTKARKNLKKAGG